LWHHCVIMDIHYTNALVRETEMVNCWIVLMSYNIVRYYIALLLLIFNIYYHFSQVLYIQCHYEHIQYVSLSISSTFWRDCRWTQWLVFDHSGREMSWAWTKYKRDGKSYGWEDIPTWGRGEDSGWKTMLSKRSKNRQWLWTDNK